VEFASEHHDGRGTMLSRLWALLDEADIVVSWNGDSFDLPWIRGELATAGYTPPSAFISVDLIKTARSFRLDSNRLDDVAQLYGRGSKMDTGGIDLWKACLAGDRKAWDKMRRYNRRDVILTERLLDDLWPWIKNLPHRGQWTRDRECCPSCGSTDLTLVGITYTKTLEYPKLRCDDCERYCRVNRNGDTRPL
jgi:DNA polymerase elongation subunit (family B)